MVGKSIGLQLEVRCFYHEQRPPLQTQIVTYCERHSL